MSCGTEGVSKMMAMRLLSDWHDKPLGLGKSAATCTGGRRERARGVTPMRLVGGQLFVAQPTSSSRRRNRACDEGGCRPLAAVLADAITMARRVHADGRNWGTRGLLTAERRAQQSAEAALTGQAVTKGSQRCWGGAASPKQASPAGGAHAHRHRQSSPEQSRADHHHSNAQMPGLPGFSEAATRQKQGAEKENCRGGQGCTG